jgi:LacI family xylobiose transport system transcriptional regulator
VIATHSYFTPREHALLTASSIPLVALDPSGMPPDSVPAVSAANWNGGVAAARHVVDLGHRRIAVISGPAKSLIARARLEACRAVLDAAGIPLAEDIVRSGQFDFEAGMQFAQELLSRAERPTAIICGNDLQALGVYEAARRAGLRIPEDVSVVGFDDVESARRCGPPMTTVRQPFDDMGAAAARLALTYARWRDSRAHPDRTADHPGGARQHRQAS